MSPENALLRELSWIASRYASNGDAKGHDVTMQAYGVVAEHLGLPQSDPCNCVEHYIGSKHEETIKAKAEKL